MDRMELLRSSAQIASAFGRHQSINDDDLCMIITQSFSALAEIDNPQPKEPKVTPAVSVKKSVTNTHLTCLICGRKLKMLKRHLASEHGITTTEYRNMFKLSFDYPMTAPAYSDFRSREAVRNGLGNPRVRSHKNRRKK